MKYLLFIFLVSTSCSTFFTPPTRKDTKNLGSSVSIEAKQVQIERRASTIEDATKSKDFPTRGPQIKENAVAIKQLAKETRKESVKIQNRSDGQFHLPNWLIWGLIIFGLGYLGLLPVIAGIAIKTVHKIAKGIKAVDYP